MGFIYLHNWDLMKRLNVDGFVVEKFGALQRNDDIF
jgi:hypothetical protein